MGPKPGLSKVFEGYSIRNLCCIIFLICFTITECTPPYGRGRGGCRRNQNRNHCHENSHREQENNQNVQNPENVNLPPIKGDGIILELYPEGVKFSQDPDPFARDGDITLKVYPPAKEDEDESPPDAGILPVCPAGSGIYKPTGKCYPFTNHNMMDPDPSQSPCGQFMDFYKNPIDPIYGECDCREGRILGALRPTVWWEKQDRCYWLFDQGPCRRGEWLVLDENDRPTCAKRSCEENSPEDWSSDPTEGSKKNFYFRYRGKCYKTGTKAFCDGPIERVNFHATKETGIILKCTMGIETRVILYGVKDLPCKPGHKIAINGQCTRVYEFD